MKVGRHMESIIPIRTLELGHHLLQAGVWLSKSEEGVNTSYLSYAAFELRLATERLALQYWAALQPDGIPEKNFKDLKSFKGIENRIYELGGHQKEIDALFSFHAIVLEMIGIHPPITPNVGRLKKHWHACSELCHVAWSVVSGNPDVQKETYVLLVEVCEELGGFISGAVGWPYVKNAAFFELKERFIAGKASSDDVRSYVKKIGAWAKFIPNNGGPAFFVGKPVPPDNGGTDHTE